MTTQTKILGVVGIVLAIALYGAYVFPKSTTNYVGVSSSTASTTFQTAKVAAINITPSSASATSSSLYNSDGADRIVTDAFVTCYGVGTVFAQTGAGVSAWIWQAATTSTYAPAVLPGIGLAAMNMSVSTSTGDTYAATTTYTSPFSRRWNAGSYLTIQPNATSSTASCQAGVHYLAQ